MRSVVVIIITSLMNGDDHVLEIDVKLDPSVLVRKGCEVIEGLDVEVVALTAVANQKCHFNLSFHTLIVALLMLHFFTILSKPSAC